MDAFDGLVREATLTVAIIALPVLAVAAIVGTAIAVLQAATQIQEQTLTVLPKVVAVGAVLVAGGSFALGLCARLFSSALHAIPAIVGR